MGYGPAGSVHKRDRGILFSPKGGIVAQWNPATLGARLALSNNNRTVARTNGANATGNAGVMTNKSLGSVKTYCEFLLSVWQPNGVTGANSSPQWGIVDNADTAAFVSDSGLASLSSGLPIARGAGRVIWYAKDGAYGLQSEIAITTAVPLGGRLMIAYDGTAKRVYFGVNGVWQFGGNPSAGTGGLDGSALGADARFAFAAWNTTDANDTSVMQPGNADFLYPKPTGYVDYLNGAA